MFYLLNRILVGFGFVSKKSYCVELIEYFHEWIPGDPFHAATLQKYFMHIRVKVVFSVSYPNVFLKPLTNQSPTIYHLATSHLTPNYPLLTTPSQSTNDQPINQQPVAPIADQATTEYQRI